MNAPTSRDDQPNHVDGNFARRLHGLYMSLHIELSEDIAPDVTVPVVNRGYQPTTVDLERLRGGFEAIISDAQHALALVKAEIHDHRETSV